MPPRSEELVPVEAFPTLFNPDANDLSGLIEENFGPDGVRPLDLDRIGIPPGGGTAWEIPTLGGTEPSKTLDGIILHWTSPRAFWRVSISDGGGNNPPDCSSDDGEFGVGEFGRHEDGSMSEENPTGQCHTCPMNQWGSDPKGGRGKACRESRQLFVLRPGDIVPVVLALPVTSIAPLRKYMLRLASAGKPYFGVVTRFTLEQQQSESLKWSIAVPTVLADLSADEAEKVKEFAKSVKG